MVELNSNLLLMQKKIIAKFLNHKQFIEYIRRACQKYKQSRLQEHGMARLEDYATKLQKKMSEVSKN